MKLKIKIVITALLSVLCFLPAFTVFAAADDYTVKEQDGFVITYGDKNIESVAKIMGVTKSELKKKFKDENILFIAVNTDNSIQIRLSRYETELSKKVEDISYLSDGLLSDIFPELENDNYIKTAIGKTPFIKNTETLLDSGGNYTSNQYVTIKNGYVYQISVYVSENAEQNLADDFVNNVRILNATIYSPRQKILVACGIAVFVILIIIMIRGIIKDIRAE